MHEAATPGKYIVMHGVRGRLGDQVTRLDGSSATDVVIRETPFDELMTQFVYRSKYAKYRTRITSLEEFLVESRPVRETAWTRLRFLCFRLGHKRDRERQPLQPYR